MLPSDCQPVHARQSQIWRAGLSELPKGLAKCCILVVEKAPVVSYMRS